MATTEGARGGLGSEAHLQLERLLGLRQQLRDERSVAVTPAVARALEVAEIELFLGLTYLGYTDSLFPHEG